MTRLMFVSALFASALVAGCMSDNCASCACSVPVQLAEPFSDGAVLQRGMKVPVWGSAAPGAEVTVTFAGQTLSARADAAGAWRVDLQPMDASCEGRTLRAASGACAAEASDILVGEVWFCAGQSNTEQPLVGKDPRFRDAKGAMRAQLTNRPLIRFCHQSNYKTAVSPKSVCAKKVAWKAFTPENLAASPSFSAMGVYYALEVHAALGIPVGIVGTYWGGTRAEPWTPESGLRSVEATAALASAPRYDAAAFEKLEKKPCHRLMDQPTVLWNEMVAPWTPYAIRGFIWYQGCSNAGEGFGYVAKMHALYNGWSKEFENPELKLRFVQLAPWGYEGIATIQMAQQRFAAEQKNAKMAVINDRGNLSDIHPNDKETVGQRLALLSLKYDYGFGIKADSPTVKDWKVEGDAFVVTFDNAESLYLYNPDRSVRAGFEICGADGAWKPAVIRNLHNNTPKGKPTYRGLVDGGAKLVLAADGVAEPKKLRYLHSRPWFGCVYNEVDLPLGAFAVDAQ